VPYKNEEEEVTTKPKASLLHLAKRFFRRSQQKVIIKAGAQSRAPAFLFSDSRYLILDIRYWMEVDSSDQKLAAV
jgi:hypothetical protein